VHKKAYEKMTKSFQNDFVLDEVPLQCNKTHMVEKQHFLEIRSCLL